MIYHIVFFSSLMYVHALSVISFLQLNLLLKNFCFPPASISFVIFRVEILR